MMLEVRGLQFAYKKHQVLQCVNFSADAGEFICLLGENGAGKTTLFRCILGFLNGYQGEIFIDGINAKQLSVHETARRIAYIPQAHEPTFNYSVFETVLMGTNTGLEKFRTPGALERKITMELLELLDIAHLAERGYAQISGGERQLTLIARGLAQRSSILVMDEPTANLDYGNQFRVMKQIRQLAKQGYLILLSTHNPEHAMLYGQKALVLKDGQISSYGEPKVVLTPSIIQRIYGVSVEIQTMRASWGTVPVFLPCFEHGL